MKVCGKKEWGPADSLCVDMACLPREGNLQLCLNILPSEEWDSTSSRLLMAVFMNNANFVIIQKV